MKRINSIVLLIYFASDVFAGSVPGLDLLERVLDRFEFMPEYHMTGDLYGMTHYKNADYKRRYFVESNADLEFVLVSYRRRLVVGNDERCRFRCHYGGQARRANQLNPSPPPSLPPTPRRINSAIK